MDLYKVFHHLGLKKRYLFTRHGNIRLRVVLFCMTVLILLSFLYTSSRDVFPLTEANNQSSLSVTDIVAHQDPQTGVITLTSNTKDQEDEIAVHSGTVRVAHMPFPKPDKRRFTMQSGDTLSVLLERASVAPNQAYQLVQSLSDKVDPRDLKAGQKIDIEYIKTDTGELDVSAVYLPVSQLEKVTVAKSRDGQFVAQKRIKTYSMHKQGVKAQINAEASSLYLALAKEGVPHDIIAAMIRAYSWDIDFQRDIWTGNTINLLYEKAVDEDGETVTGKNKLIFAHLTTRLKDLPIYRFQETGKSFHDFFHADGRSVRALLMSTPIDGARLSSGFGRRKHPVLGYTKIHKGVDFAAPRGTPIYAAGDGVVERASRFSSFGHYIRIKHKGSLKTAYAHLKGYAKGIRAGKRVKQGQIIGYVGTTGRSTGPHLHYEVIQNGTHINPRSIKLPTGDKLVGADMERFKAQAVNIDRDFGSSLRDKGQVAVNNATVN